MNSSAKNLKQFATLRFLDQVAFLIVLFCIVGAAGLIAQTSIVSPFSGTIVILTYAVFARWIISFTWHQATEGK